MEKVTASELAGADVEQTPTSVTVAVPVAGALTVAKLTKSSRIWQRSAAKRRRAS